MIQFIDNTYLNISSREEDLKGVENVCQEAKEHGFPAVCVRPDMIMTAREFLQGTNVKVATVIGFPKEKLSEKEALETLGSATVEEKLAEAEDAINNGANELDVVVNVPMVITSNAYYIFKETEQILNATNRGPEQVLTKFILETGVLGEDRLELVTEAIASAKAGVEERLDKTIDVMYKTSTGFVKENRTAEEIYEKKKSDVKFLVAKGKKHKIGVKVSGGIRTPEQAREMIGLGVDRIGTSSGSALLAICG